MKNVLACLAMLVPLSALAQTADQPAFEVASIKPSPPDGGGFRLFLVAGGRLLANNATLKQLVVFAYNVRGPQVSGGPKWLDTYQFNIEARPGNSTQIPEGPARVDTFRAMVRSLLESRFSLAVRRESRDEQIYELHIARNGPKLKETAPSSAPQGLFQGRNRVDGKAAKMSMLAAYLSNPAGRDVIDKTGLTGTYDFTLSWSPDLQESAPGTDPASDANGPSIFTAVQEQLGLKLDRARGPVEFLVIDHAEKPAEN